MLHGCLNYIHFTTSTLLRLNQVFPDQIHLSSQGAPTENDHKKNAGQLVHCQLEPQAASFNIALFGKNEVFKKVRVITEHPNSIKKYLHNNPVCPKSEANYLMISDGLHIMESPSQLTKTW